MQVKELKIKRWLKSGEFDTDSIATADDILEQAGGMLDHAYSQEITGECVFEAEDGRLYEGSVVFTIYPLTGDRLKEIRAEDKAEQGQEE